jgi:hypothetical protein
VMLFAQAHCERVQPANAGGSRAARHFFAGKFGTSVGS